jgi:hypothetical protein
MGSQGEQGNKKDKNRGKGSEIIKERHRFQHRELGGFREIRKKKRVRQHTTYNIGRIKLIKPIKHIQNDLYML